MSREGLPGLFVALVLPVELAVEETLTFSASKDAAVE